MRLRAKDLRRYRFEWPEPLDDRFNFQREEHIEALVERLLDNGPPAVVVLGGERGIGRGFLCDAAAQRARDQGHKVAVWHLDLDGFEPDVENPLARYLRHLIDQEERQVEVTPAAKTLRQLDLAGPASELAASLLSLLWQLGDPLEPCAELLSRPPDGSGAPPRDDPATLHRLLAELTRYHRLLIHVSDGPQLTSNLRRWLIREVEQAPDHLLLVIGCPLAQATERAAPRSSNPAFFDLLPLDPSELRVLLDRCFAPNKLPGDLIPALMQSSHGWPAAVASQLADLMAAGLRDPGLVDAFSRGLFAEVEEPLTAMAEEEPELARALLDLLFLASLCGRYVPMALLLEHLGLDEATTEAAFDWVDDVLVGELGWMTDLGFQVPGFEGYGVYAFVHPLLPQVLQAQEPEVAQEGWAENLLRFLEQRVPVDRKGWARCRLSIAGHLGDHEQDRELFERMECTLAWWVGLDAVDALQAEVREAIERQEIEPELAWRVARDSNAWPASRRLALLEACAQATAGEGGAVAIDLLPADALADFHLLRADLLREEGRHAEALAGALSALELVSREPLHELEAAMVLGGHVLEEELPAPLTARSRLADLLWALGDLTHARKLHEQTLGIAARVLGGEHSATVYLRNKLAKVGE